MKITLIEKLTIDLCCDIFVYLFLALVNRSSNYSELFRVLYLELIIKYLFYFE